MSLFKKKQPPTPNDLTADSNDITLSPVAKAAQEAKKTGTEVPVETDYEPPKKWWEAGSEIAYKSGANVDDFTVPEGTPDPTIKPKFNSADFTFDFERSRQKHPNVPEEAPKEGKPRVA